ncbi:signal peptide peptidase SppA [Robertkochia sediminum]|uniref:signal peptide peptidase SppA n=1 Tax=Robertkochia sediminum TaxID=2785326 RepID=UPI0019346A3C|nr:signal peptide peptidase SppA [Robertkochia sediminum]MBL7472384.1 signal peptide peptidase SppA [Robertkochia sediminum]
MNFLRNLLASILGTLIALGIIFMFFLLIMTAATAGAEPVVRVKDNSVLRISLQGVVPDYGGQYRIDDLDFEFEEYIGLNHLVRAIDHAATDDRIKGITIENSMIQSGSATTQTLRKALQRFKESGKFIYAYADLYTQKDYWMASVADSVFLNPQGIFDFRGLSSEVLFFGDFQEKSGLRMEVVRHGKYKSAVEPFLGNAMSNENRKQISELLEGLWSVYLEDISNSRGIPVKTLNTYADNLAARTPFMAAENGLTDGVLYADEYKNLLKTTMGLDTDDDIRTIDLEDYAESTARLRSKTGDRIAVVYAQGDIGYGKGSNDMIAQGIMYESLQDAREDSRVKAIVLRVNSPGGLALTSDLIWREVEVTQKVKPVVISMGNYAASGGYYIAAAGDRIFAEPTTITGSIGVFATIPNVRELAAKWGINAEQVNTNKNSTAYSLFEAPSESFLKYSKESIEENYNHFLQVVAEGRGMTPEEVNEVAQGRVWSGVQAREKGLVDELGSLDDAVAYAAQLVEVADYVTVDYPVYESNFADALSDLGIGFFDTKEELLKEELGEEVYQLMMKIKHMAGMKGVQARLPYELKIQ